MKIIYLYLKTHNITGLKYLGKTISKDPHKYKGSGVYWKNHITEHGYDVTTEILFETTNKEEFKKVALEYSKKWNIVESKGFANLTVEEGHGGWDYVYKNAEINAKRIKGLKEDSLGSIKAAETIRKRRAADPEYDAIMKERLATFKGKKHSEKTKQKMSNQAKKHSKGKKNSQYGTHIYIKKDALDKSDRKRFKEGEQPKDWISTKEWDKIQQNKKVGTSNTGGRSWYNDGAKSFILAADNPKIKFLSKGRLKTRFAKKNKMV